MSNEKRPWQSVLRQGLTRHWRTGGQDIPWQVASQQSLPPLLLAGPFQQKAVSGCNYWTSEQFLRKSIIPPKLRMNPMLTESIIANETIFAMTDSNESEVTWLCQCVSRWTLSAGRPNLVERDLPVQTGGVGAVPGMFDDFRFAESISPHGHAFSRAARNGTGVASGTQF